MRIVRQPAPTVKDAKPTVTVKGGTGTPVATVTVDEPRPKPSTFEPGKQPAAQTAAPNGVDKATKEELRAAELSSRLISVGYLAGVKQWGERSANEKLGAAVKALLTESPEVLATLTGERLFVKLDVPEYGGPRFLGEVSLVATRLGAMTGQRFSVEHDEAKDEWFLLNETAFKQQARKAGVKDETYELFGHPDNRARVDKLQAKMTSDISGLPKQLRDAGGPGTAPRHQQTLANVGFITYASRPEHLERLKTTLKEWDDNLALYGHQVTIRVSDDSTGEWAKQVRQAVEGFQSRSGSRFVYFGTDEKAALKQDVVERLVNSPKAKEWIGDRKTTADELNGMVQDLFGDDTKKGPTRNRNISMLSNRFERTLQLDDDNEPAAMMTGARQHLLKFWQEKGLDPSTVDPGKSGPAVDDELAELQPGAARVPVDLVTFYLRSKDLMESPTLTGAEDMAISEVVTRVPRAVDSDFDAAEKDLEAAGELGRLVKTLEGPAVNRPNWAPMFVPEQYGPANDYVPWTAPIRDGDLIVTWPQSLAMQKDHPNRANTDRRYNATILQTEIGGSRSAKANVLYDTMIGTAYMTALGAILGKITSRLPGEQYKETLARYILTELGKQKSSTVADAVKSTLTEYRNGGDARLALGENFVEYATERVGELKKLSATLGGARETAAMRMAAAQWELGSEDHAGELPDPLPREQLATWRTEIDAAVATLRRDIDLMNTKLHLGQGREKAVQLVSDELVPTVRKYLRDYALSLVFSDEILGTKAQKLQGA